MLISSYHSSHLTSSHLISTDLVLSELRALWMVAAIMWTGSCAVKWPSLLWLRPITAHSVQMKWGELRWDQTGIMRWGEVRWDEWWETSVTHTGIILYTAHPSILTSLCHMWLCYLNDYRWDYKLHIFNQIFISLNFNMNGCNNMVHLKRCNNCIFVL